MKTPREILLERHQAAAPKLDAVRREIVSELNHQETKAQSSKMSLVSWCLSGFQKIWLELIWPCRRVWTGLVAIWFLILVVNFSLRDSSQTMAMKPSPSPEMILSFQQQEKLLTELVGQDEPHVAEPVKTFVPQPRSERQIEILTA